MRMKTTPGLDHHPSNSNFFWNQLIALYPAIDLAGFHVCNLQTLSCFWLHVSKPYENKI